ncbi:MAG TPA: efflux RND transporter periplasmic adaptor subunit [Candidatus Eisenbacteria bacterium]|nr:efflux RND transporter periplasmic adaptor subunit [Candidatus Eisenbacteria bacterium]
MRWRITIRAGRWASRAVALVLGLLLLGGALYVQHRRHGWPFSLHHDSATPRAGERHPAQPRRDSVAAVASRVTVEMDPERLGEFGIRVEAVRVETITRPVRVVANVLPDETRIAHVHARVSGWIERLYVNVTGQQVRRGQPLASVFSQELLSSQGEYLSALRANDEGPRSVVAEGARSRLKVLGMTDSEIETIERSGEPHRVVTLTAPRGGVVLHRGVSAGTAVDPSTEIVTIADLSHVWVIAEVPEAEIPEVRPGLPATLEFPASGRDPLPSRVEWVAPTISERTRTLRVRFGVDNRSGSLRPGLYGTAEFSTEPRQALVIPRDALVDTGREQFVFVQAGEGRFVPRRVQVGTRLADRIEVRTGLAVGDEVVSAGVFLIDSESRLRASGGAGTAHGEHGSRSETKSSDQREGYQRRNDP